MAKVWSLLHLNQFHARNGHLSRGDTQVLIWCAAGSAEDINDHSFHSISIPPESFLVLLHGWLFRCVVVLVDILFWFMVLPCRLPVTGPPPPVAPCPLQPILNNHLFYIVCQLWKALKLMYTVCNFSKEKSRSLGWLICSNALGQNSG